jgi:peptidoglycan/xylan/chitin deacetylase (PgdA/CDA1 family)
MKLNSIKSSNTIHELRRRYAQWRSVATNAEARSYNGTKRILLTFDDYGTPENIRGILDVLAREGVKAFFFINGEWVEKSKKNALLIKEIEQQGHWIGSHSYNHVRLDELSNAEIERQLRQGLQTKIMRPPYGAYNPQIRKIAQGLGFKISYWTVDSFDWKGISAAQIKENVLPKIHKGACVLMHLNTAHTLEALPGLITGIRERGFELCHDGSEIKA